MLAHSYDVHTGRFIGSESADPDPLEDGNFLIPAAATTVEPPAEFGKLWPYWNGEAWELRDEGTPERERLMRKNRAEALTSSDWTQLPDAPITKATRDLWRAYRQDLRDLTKNSEWPFVELPTKPDVQNGSI